MRGLPVGRILGLTVVLGTPRLAVEFDLRGGMAEAAYRMWPASVRSAARQARRGDGALAARLRVMPAVVLTGARQTGRSTLVEQLVPRERRYRSLDDFDVRDAARRDPAAHRTQGRVAHPRRAGRTVVEGAVMWHADRFPMQKAGLSPTVLN